MKRDNNILNILHVLRSLTSVDKCKTTDQFSVAICQFVWYTREYYLLNCVFRGNHASEKNNKRASQMEK